MMIAPNGRFCEYRDYEELKALYDDAVQRFTDLRQQRSKNNTGEQP
jgi:hypothetical protein